MKTTLQAKLQPDSALPRHRPQNGHALEAHVTGADEAVCAEDQ